MERTEKKMCVYIDMYVYIYIYVINKLLLEGN